MGKAEKILDKIKTNPKNVRFEKLCKVLKNKGYDIINIKGSHYAFSNGMTTMTIVNHMVEINSVMSWMKRR